MKRPSIEALIKMLEKTIEFDQQYAEELAKSGKMFDAFTKIGEAAGIAFAVWHLRNWQSKNPPNNGVQANAEAADTPQG